MHTLYRSILVKHYLKSNLNTTHNFISKFARLKMATQSSNEETKAKRYVFDGTNANPMFHLETTPIPSIADGEVLVKVKAATLCLSDIHTVCGTRVEPTPSVLGHEACAEVVSHKRQDSNIQIGDRVTFTVADSCGKCDFCTNGLSQKCTSLFKYGHAVTSNGTGYNGCYASHIVLRKGTHIKKLPDEISDELASTINCALATVVNIVDSIPSSLLQSGKKAFIQGDGLLGLYCCALLRENGLSTVYCLGRRTSRVPLIQKMGGIPLNPSDKMDHEYNKIDCVIEVCGNSEVVQDGMKLLKPGGAYIFAGMVHPKSHLNITAEQIIRKCLTIKGVHNYDARHLDKAVEFLKNTWHKYPYNELISPKIFKLEEFPEAVDEAKLKNYTRICIEP